jgi:hypothetical protein
MSTPSPPSSADAIEAAAHELKRRRNAEATARALAGKARTKGDKPGKPKTVPCKVRLAESEYRELGKLKKRLARQGVDTGKEQLVRAGLLLLAHLDASDLKTAIRDVIAPEPETDESE